LRRVGDFLSERTRTFRIKLHQNARIIRLDPIQRWLRPTRNLRLYSWHRNRHYKPGSDRGRPGQRGALRHHLFNDLQLVHQAGDADDRSIEFWLHQNTGKDPRV
jgi:hypothetical protein